MNNPTEKNNEGERPLISVIIATHNSAATLGRAIQSMIDQTYRNIEIIVVDDCGTDNAREIVGTFTGKDSRVSYHRLDYDDPKRINWRGINVNVGYIARNYGMDISKGEWITFQDDDDASLRNRIEVQYELAKKYNAMHVTVSWQALTEKVIGKKLDVDRIFKEQKVIMFTPDDIAARAKRAKGILMGKWFPHDHVPFPIKWNHITRKLFFNTKEPYAGADNSMLFKREVIAQVRWRHRDKRIWPATSGRGVGRDFNYQIAETFRNSYSFELPLYLWKVRAGLQNQDFIGYEKYLID